MASLGISSVSFGSGSEDMDCFDDNQLLAAFDHDRTLKGASEPEIKSTDLIFDVDQANPQGASSPALKRARVTASEKMEPAKAISSAEALIHYTETTMNAQVRRARERLSSVRTFLLVLNRVELELPFYNRIPRDIRTKICRFMFEPHHLEPDAVSECTKQHFRDLIRLTPFVRSISFSNGYDEGILFSGWFCPMQEILGLHPDNARELSDLISTNDSKYEIRSLYKGPLALEKIREVLDDEKYLDEKCSELRRLKRHYTHEEHSGWMNKIISILSKKYGLHVHLFPKNVGQSNKLSMLVSLDLGVSGYLEDEDMKRLSLLTHIKSIKLQHDIGSTGMAYIAQSFKNLICFDVNRVDYWNGKNVVPKKLKEDPLKMLIKNNKELRYFRVENNSMSHDLEDNLIKILSEYCPHLLFVELGKDVSIYNQGSIMMLLKSSRSLLYINQIEDGYFQDYETDEEQIGEYKQLLRIYPCLKYMYAALCTKSRASVKLINNSGTKVEAHITTTEQIRVTAGQLGHYSGCDFMPLTKECIRYRIDLLDGSVSEIE